MFFFFNHDFFHWFGTPFPPGLPQLFTTFEPQKMVNCQKSANEAVGGVRDALVDHEDGAPRPHGVAAEIQVERTPGGGD